ncbi:MAG TPA: hypothetical protein VFW98_06715, partial [Gemmatimonadaceae bacterium]|nr:hypothetical protein [Gemmatimonadaceae bacterium]
MSRTSMLVAVALAALPIGAAGAQQLAPSGKCQLQFESNAKTRVSFTQQPSGEYNTYLGGGVRAHCPAQKMTLIADSAQSLGDQRVLYLIGHVHYTEPRLTLTSHRLTYYEATERIVAEGDVHSRLPSGTTMVGPRAEYFRAVPGVRTQAHMISTGRPTFKIIQVDSSGKPAEPMTVIANRVATVADSLVFASGRVEMTRPDVVAHGDSAAVDSGHEFARLMR